jgi:hypothetical protein
MVLLLAWVAAALCAVPLGAVAALCCSAGDVFEVEIVYYQGKR